MCEALRASSEELMIARLDDSLKRQERLMDVVGLIKTVFKLTNFSFYFIHIFLTDFKRKFFKGKPLRKTSSQ